MGLGCVTMLAVALALPTQAAAQRCQAPPGSSGVDQYCEVVPGPGGDRGPNDPASDDPAVGQPTRRALEDAGVDQDSLKRLLGNKASAKRRARAAGSDLGPAIGVPREGNPLSAVRLASEDRATSESGFVWLLVATGLAMTGLAWRRFRMRDAGDDAPRS